MLYRNIQNVDNALAYLVDCTLATVEKMSTLKNPPKGELKRQIAIAQRGIDFMDTFNIDRKGTRAEEVVTTVQEYSDDIHLKYHDTENNEFFHFGPSPR